MPPQTCLATVQTGPRKLEPRDIRIPDFVSDKVVFKKIRIQGVMGVTWNAYAAAIRMIESRRTPIAKMHTHDFSLLEAERAILTWRVRSRVKNQSTRVYCRAGSEYLEFN